jgi:hypothetical protein
MNQKNPFLRAAIKLLLCIGVLVDIAELERILGSIIMGAAFAGTLPGYMAVAIIILGNALPVIAFLAISYIIKNEPDSYMVATVVLIGVLLSKYLS